MSRVIKSARIIEQSVESKSQSNSLDLDLKAKDIINDAREEYDNIIKKAQTLSNEIILKASDKADKILDSTYEKSKQALDDSKEKGYQEGYKLGYSEGKNKSENLIKEANAIKREFTNEKNVFLQTIESDLIELVLVSCEKILNDKLRDDEELIINIIKNGLKNFNNSTNIVVRISSDDYNIVELSKERILSYSTYIDDIILKKDNSLSKGDCIIETSNGSVDTSISKQINQLKKTLKNLLNSE